MSRTETILTQTLTGFTNDFFFRIFKFIQHLETFRNIHSTSLRKKFK